MLHKIALPNLLSTSVNFLLFFGIIKPVLILDLKDSSVWNGCSSASILKSRREDSGQTLRIRMLI